MRLAIYFFAAALWAQPGLPDTSAGRVLAKWLESFNSGDRARIEAFMKVHEPERLDYIDETLGFRKETGGFTLISVDQSQDRSIRATVKERNSDTVATLEMSVSAAEPPLIEKLGLRARGPGSSGPPPQRLDGQGALDALLKEAAGRADKDQFSGALLIARHGKVVLEKAYGLADRSRRSPNTIETQFRIGSMNKMFTAAATLQLVSKGKLGLNDPISKHWPDYPNKELAAKVRVRHLLSHTGGTGDIFGPEFEKRRLELKTLADYGTLYGQRGLQFEPGTRWEYSNYGFLLLGLLIERVSGQSYYDYVRENIFKPAGMRSTDSLPETETVARRSTGYMKRKGEWIPNSGTLPWRGTSAGGGYSTVRDLYLFAEALLSGKILKREFVEMAAKKQFNDPDAPPDRGYGFGFVVTPDSFGHGGGAPGMNGELNIYPKTGAVVVVLSNLDPPAATQLARYYTDRMPLN